MRADALRLFTLFDHLPQDELDRLAETLPEHDFTPGEVPFEEGSQTGYFYGVLEGEVEIVKSLGTADERVVAVSRKGALLGEMSLFSRNGSHTASVRARTPLKLFEITFDQFDAILRRNPSLAYDLLHLYSRRLEESESLTIQDLREKNRQLTLAYEELQAAQADIIEKEKLERELHIAAEIQRSILPEEIPVYLGVDLGALMVPARSVGGDFYDLIPLSDHQVGIVVGDVCDKGMPAALLMALTYSSARTEAFRHATPGAMLRAVNAHLLQINHSGLYVTLLYGILDCYTGQFTYARAGHPAPLVLDAASQPVELPYGLGQPVGIFDDLAIDEQAISIPSGGTLLVYSDGLSETIEAQENAPTLPRMVSAIAQKDHPSAQAVCDALWREAGGGLEKSPIQDDFTVVVARLYSKPA